MKTIRLTATEATKLSLATELYSRLFMGQFSDLRWHGPPNAKLWNQDFDEAIKAATGSVCRYFGINAREVPEDARIAFDCHQVIRHRLAWDRNPKGGITVDFDHPFFTSRLGAYVVIKGDPDNGYRFAVPLAGYGSDRPCQRGGHPRQGGSILGGSRDCLGQIASFL